MSCIISADRRLVSLSVRYATVSSRVFGCQIYAVAAWQTGIPSLAQCQDPSGAVRERAVDSSTRCGGVGRQRTSRSVIERENICPDRMWTGVDIFQAFFGNPDSGNRASYLCASGAQSLSGECGERGGVPGDVGRSLYWYRLRTTVSRISQVDVWGRREHMGL